MENASLATQAKVRIPARHVRIDGGGTRRRTWPACSSGTATSWWLPGLAQVAAVSAQARRFPSVQFVVPGPALAGSHVIGLRVPAAGLPAAVADVITVAIRRSD